MRCRKMWILGAALCGALLCGSSSQAGSISWIATGTPALYVTADGMSSVTYTSLGLSMATVPPPSNVSLGTLTTASTAPDGTPSTVGTAFTLTVTEVLPTSGPSITFTGFMAGGLSTDASSAYLQFTSPLSQNLGGFIFTIVNADQGMPGRINLNAPTTNGGVSSISATVSMAAIPEPASAVLLGLAIPALAGLAYRRNRR